jgi:hypothetical protein
MAGCIANDGYLYIYGGQDLKEGPFSSIWRTNMDLAVKGTVRWENIDKWTTMQPPFSYSHHCGVSWNSKLYFFGGSRAYAGKLNGRDQGIMRE